MAGTMIAPGTGSTPQPRVGSYLLGTPNPGLVSWRPKSGWPRRPAWCGPSTGSESEASPIGRSSQSWSCVALASPRSMSSRARSSLHIHATGHPRSINDPKTSAAGQGSGGSTGGQRARWTGPTYPPCQPPSHLGKHTVVVRSLAGDRRPTGPAWVSGRHQGPVSVAQRGGGAAEEHRWLIEGPRWEDHRRDVEPGLVCRPRVVGPPLDMEPRVGDGILEREPEPGDVDDHHRQGAGDPSAPGVPTAITLPAPSSATDGAMFEAAGSPAEGHGRRAGSAPAHRGSC